MPSNTILVVDDDPLILQAVKDELESVGYRVAVAGDGKEAIRLHNAKPFELIITDLLMPEIDGLETIIEIRTRSKNMKIIAMSSGRYVNIDVAMFIGAAQVLKKPFSREQLLKMVNECLGPD